METLKVRLLSTGVFIDNEYLDKYVELVESNYDTKSESYKTQSHHIIPKCFYKLNGIAVDNSPQNRVNLIYLDHILAHCYIVMATNECQFKYFNYCAVNHLMGHRDIKDFVECVSIMDDAMKAYESAKYAIRKSNPMFDADVKEKHSSICKTRRFRESISDSLREYRKNNPFSEEHRRKISEAMRGNRNFGSGDTRSIGCYCVDSRGERHGFHSIKDGTVWWFDNYKPFGERYVLITLQRKIRKSIDTGESFGGVTWYVTEKEKSCAETIESV